MDYLSLPFALRKGYLSRTDLYDSIAQSIGLILSTRYGSLPFDPDFGCDIWDKEFSDIYTTNKSEIQGSIRNAISRYEPRLFNMSVSLVNVATRPDHALGIAVRVAGNFRDEGEEKKFEEVFNIG